MKGQLLIIIGIMLISMTACNNKEDDYQVEKHTTEVIKECETSNELITEKSDDKESVDVKKVLFTCENNTSKVTQMLQEKWEDTLGEEVYSYKQCYNVTGDKFNKVDEERELIFYFYTFDEKYITTYYKSVLNVVVDEKKVHIIKQENISFEEITTASQALEIAGLIQFKNDYVDGLENEEMDIASHIYEKSIEKYKMLGKDKDAYPLVNPDISLPMLMHYEGGKSETIDDSENYSVITTYTFEDESSISYVMRRDNMANISNGVGEFWFPFYYTSADQVDIARKVQKYINQVTVDELKSIENVTDISELSVREIPEIYTSDMFSMIYKDAQQDMALYSINGGYAMVLRDKDDVYPISLSCGGPRGVVPNIHKADYDKDGKEEYALYRYTGSGTGVSIAQLYMLEETDAILEINEFTVADVRYQMQNIQYEYDEENEIVHIDTNAEVYDLKISEYLKMYEAQYSYFTCGDIIDVVLIDGQWWLEVGAGIVTKESVIPQYDCGVTYCAPINYMENGYFQLGDITIKTRN